MKLSKEIKTAVLVIVSILIFIWGYGFLRGKDLFSSYRTFYVFYDNVEGLSTSASVVINGLSVGKVNGIMLQPNGKLLVEVQVKSDFPVSKSSVLQIYEPGFIGGKQIAILPNFQDNTLAQNKDTLQGIIKLGMLVKMEDQLAPVQSKIENTLISADSLITNFNTLLNHKNKENLSIAIADFTQTMKSLNSSTRTLDKMLSANQQNIDEIISNLNTTTSNFQKISDSIAQANLGQTIKNLETTLENVNKIMADLEDGKGTLGKLMKDDQMYDNFTKASKELELLLQDLRLNPTRYINISIFGKKNKPYVAPENE